MKAVDIIKETVEYYKTNQRGFRQLPSGNENCLYLTDNGDMCAVGRCLNKNFLKRQAAKLNYLGSFRDLTRNIELIDSRFKKKYQGKPQDFWESLQNFHDDTDDWIKTDTGWDLTEAGIIHYNELLERYAND
jgi:hypothetical protein